MEFNSIREAIQQLAFTNYKLEETYTENGGEITEETEALEEQKAALTYLLQNEGVDELGRWLKSLEDKKATFKAEKASIDSRIKATDNTIEFVKDMVGHILRETDTDKVKGSLYSFKQSVSTKTAVNAEVLDALYNAKAEAAIREAGIPGYITFKLGASVKAVPEGIELPEVFTRTSEDTVTFTKPRKAKEE